MSPGSCFRVRVALHVVVAGDIPRLAEHGLVGPPRPAEHVEDRQRHRDQDAGQDAEQGDSQERDDRQEELHLPLTPEADGALGVGEGEGGGDHDGREGRLGQVPEQAGNQDQHEGDHRGTHESRHLRPRARLLRDRGTRPARADREALEERGREVRGADPHHLLVAAHLLSGPGGEGGRRRGVWGDADTWRYAGYAALAALVATGLLHLLMLFTPRPRMFFGWIVTLVTLGAALAPFASGAEPAAKVATGLINLVLGFAIGSLVAGVGRSAVRSASPRQHRPGPPYPNTPYPNP
jgi:Family of unknown function (DUF6069)